MEERIHTIGSLSTWHFTAYLDDVRLHTGRLSRRLRIDHPEAVAVVPFLDSTHIVMVRQWRYAIGTETLEIPAGKLDPGETIEEALQRELGEETRYRAGSFSLLTSYSNEIIHLYRASHLTPATHVGDEDEISAVEVVTLDDALAMVSSGTIRDGKTIIGLLLARKAHLRNEG